MEHTFELPIGDWSDDGHGKCERIIVRCSHSISACQAGYLASCYLTGYQFHHGSHTTDEDGKFVSIGGTALVCEYEQSGIPEFAVDDLKGHGLDLSVMCDSMYEGEAYPGDATNMATIIMEFIKLSLPEMSWEFTDKVPRLFGYWDRNLNCQMGYGLFY